MKKITTLFLMLAMLLSLAACGGKTTEKPVAESSSEAPASSVQSEAPPEEKPSSSEQIKESPDKYTWYVKNYVGKNCATLGYTSLGGDRMDKYGSGILQLVFVCSDGTYVDVSSDDALKEYTVIGQNLPPNTELKYVFATDSKGEEYSNLLAHQNHEKIVLNVKKVGSSDSPVDLTEIKPSPDRYTWYTADYVGRNLLTCGYISLGGDLMDKYGAGIVKLVIVAEDGSYVDPSDEEMLKCYVVTGQNVKPNTELKLVFDKDSDGVEYDNLIETQNIEEIEVSVKRIPGAEPNYPVDESNPSVAEETDDVESSPTDSSSDNSDSKVTLVNGLRPEFKEAMDAYEDYYAEYCDFLKEYRANPTDLTLLTKYGEMTKKIEEMDEAFEKWDDNNMNDAELKYYLEVSNRVMKNLVDTME